MVEASRLRRPDPFALHYWNQMKRWGGEPGHGRNATIENVISKKKGLGIVCEDLLVASAPHERIPPAVPGVRGQLPEDRGGAAEAGAGEKVQMKSKKKNRSFN